MSKKGACILTLIGIISVTSISISGIFVQAIGIPGILSARRSANANAAMGNLKSFACAMTGYYYRSDDLSYPLAAGTGGPDLTFDKDQTYCHLTPKGGYNYRYFANATVPPVNRYVYVAWPTSLNNGTKMYYVDEDNAIWEATLSAVATTNGVVALNNLANDPASPTDPVPPSRIALTGLTIQGVWIKKS